MPNKLKQAKALGFDITRLVVWQKRSGAHEQGTNYSI